MRAPTFLELVEQRLELLALGGREHLEHDVGVLARASADMVCLDPHRRADLRKLARQPVECLVNRGLLGSGAIRALSPPAAKRVDRAAVLADIAVGSLSHRSSLSLRGISITEDPVMPLARAQPGPCGFELASENRVNPIPQLIG